MAGKSQSVHQGSESTRKKAKQAVVKKGVRTGFNDGLVGINRMPSGKKKK